jgi:alkylation response protein AidB-like acyl-CoA dehydrogenase
MTDLTSVHRAVDVALPVVAEHRDEAARTRRLPGAVVAVLRDTGINRLLLPAALGGLEAPVTDLMDVVERLSAVDGSTGWCAVIGTGSNLFSGYLPECGARKVFADPDQGSASVFAPIGALEASTVGLRLSGRWPFVSNVLHSRWVCLGATLRRDGVADPTVRLPFVPVARVTIEDTWDVAGMRATGSHHVTGDDIDVAPEHVCTFSDQPWADGALWRLPVFAVLLPGLAAVPLGIARGALDAIASAIREGRDARRGPLADDPLSIADYAAADSRLRGARAALHEAVSAAHEIAERGTRPDRRLLARLYLSHLQAAETAAEVTSVAHRLGGGAATYVGSPLLRALCDVQAARQHLQFAHKHRLALGRILAGVDVAYPPYIA